MTQKIQPKTVREALEQSFEVVVWLWRSSKHGLKQWQISELMRPLCQTALLLGFEEHEIQEWFEAAFDDLSDVFPDDFSGWIDEIWRQIVEDDQDIDALVQKEYEEDDNDVHPE